MLARLVLPSPLQLSNLLQAVPKAVAELLEILLVQEQFVLAVGHLARSVVLPLALRDGEVEILGPGGPDVEEIRPFPGLDRERVDILLRRSFRPQSCLRSPCLLCWRKR